MKKLIDILMWIPAIGIIVSILLFILIIICIILKKEPPDYIWFTDNERFMFNGLYQGTITVILIRFILF